MNRMWDGGVALPCNNSNFFPASCFLSALVVLVLSAAAGLMTFYFHYFLFVIEQCSHDFMTKSDFFIGYVEKTTILKHFFTGTLYNAFRFNVLRDNDD